MPVFIDDVEIEGDFIKTFRGYIGGLVLSGAALEEEGKKIHDGLKGYKKGEYSGVWEIAEINLSIDAQKAPAIFKFHIGFRPK